MMSFIVSKKIKQTALVTALIFSLPIAQAWVIPVNMDTDHEGDGSGKVVTTSLGNFDRCDTELDGYEQDSIPTQCHRRNLVWQLGSKNGDNEAQPLAQWNPELGDENWRLPTIKELSRLVDFSSVTGTDGALTGQPLILNMFPTQNDGFIPFNAWLISSTHRDIDGDDKNGQAQIFGINMGNGEIAAFDTVVAGSPASVETVNEVEFSDDEDRAWAEDAEYSSSESYIGDNKVEVIELVTSSVDNMDVEGTFTITGNRITNVYPISLKKCDSLDVNGVCATTDVDVYALLVYKDTVNDL